MSCLEATFTLKPRSPQYAQSANNEAALYCFGADFWSYNTDFSTLYASDQFFFDANSAADPNLDYSLWANRRKSRYLLFNMDLTAGGYGPHKQLALIFGFNVLSSALAGRVLVYSNAGLLKDQSLAYGDNQFMLELESVDQQLALFFIHAGGYWFFKGLSGYVV